MVRCSKWLFLTLPQRTRISAEQLKIWLNRIGLSDESVTNEKAGSEPCRKSLIRWSRGVESPRHCELDARQKPKCLPFPQLQPPKKNKGFTSFPIFCHHVYVTCFFL